MTEALTTVNVSLCGVELPNPLILASGILGTEAELMARVARAGAGAVTAKSCSLEPRAGHPNPTVLAWEHGLINAVGLANPGVEAEVEELIRTGDLIRPMGVALIASVFADTVENFARAAARVAEANPDLIEVNISCPNVHDEFGTPFSADPMAAAQVTAAVQRAVAGRIPVLIKLSPNVSDLAEIARAVEAAGADGITAINTLTGMVIDIHARRPVLANRTGGLSGPAIRPLAVRCVYEIYRAVEIPIVGMGGVSCGRDAVEMIMAGATAVGVGSAVYGEGPEVFGQIRDEMTALMAELGCVSVEEMRGAAHQ
ncbi:MAG TPA: dihydroorotate dehydrogenase [Anaerolineae bacterium]|nr:dihydroorotate dehydrogenase [Anaerolineae bacterium]